MNKTLWFKRKLYGWGWTPVTWQGWLITGVYIALIIFFATGIADNATPKEVGLSFLLPLLILSVAFIRTAYRTGEKPRWQWGKDRGDDDRN